MNDRSERARYDGLIIGRGKENIEHLFGRIRGYTRFVALSKWSLVGVALLLVALTIAWPLITKDHSGLRVSFTDKNSTVAAPESPVMNNLEYRGVGDQGQVFIIRGATAVQQTANLVVLTTVVSQMEQASGKTYTLTADRAEYQQDIKRVDLFGHVTLLDDAGGRFVTEHATIDTATMDVTGTDPIEGTNANGKLLASGFEIRDNGARMMFTRGDAPVTLTIDPKK
jgi:LPS export ABC transporter protein LptC